MKKIIDKIKQNENLCKVLKVLKLVLDLVVYGFTIFMVLMLAIGSNQTPKESEATNNREYIPNLVTTPVKALFDGESRSLIMSNDVLSTEFLNNTLYYGSDFILNYDLNNQLNSRKIDLNNGNLTGYNNNLITAINNVNYSGDYLPNGTLNTDYFYCDALVIDVLGKYTFGGLPMYSLQYTFVSYYNNQYNDLISFKIDCFKLSSQQSYSFSSYQVVSYQSGITTDFVINVLKNNDDYNLLYRFMSSDENKAYRDGFDNGNLHGYSEGYRAGYDNGVIVGQSGGNNPFDLIKSAFSAIASILNVQLMPGLTLSTLLFTPLIIVVVIVIVKMFRG